MKFKVTSKRIADRDRKLYDVILTPVVFGDSVRLDRMPEEEVKGIKEGHTVELTLERAAK